MISKSILFGLSFIVGTAAQAGTVQRIYKNESAPKAFRYIGQFDTAESSYSGGRLVAFGDGSKYLRFETSVLNFTQSLTDLNEGVRLNSVENKTGNKSVLVKVLSEKSKVVLFEGEYMPYESAASLKYAENIDKLVEADAEKLRNKDSASSPKEVRQIFAQIISDIDSGYSDYEHDFPLPTFDLQIEHWLGIKGPDATKAAATIRSDKQDVISKEVFDKSQSTWKKSFSEAESDLTDAIERDEDTYEQVFASYSNRVSAPGLDERLEKILQPNLKYEILVQDGFNCEDSIYTWTKAIWILKDGSEIEYSPGTECD
ncbi:MAG: hypothetical protein K0R29_1293 [Pseudobdellovibrio sp.]|nr:hypothetical protein [Pseudobdellovibrio sp.]